MAGKRLTHYAVLFLLASRVALAQPAGSGVGDFSVTVGGVPVQVIPPAGINTRSAVFFQVQGANAVACRADGVPGFSGGSLVLKGDASTPPAGGSALLQGAFADPRAWSCVAYPVGGSNTATVTAKAYP